MPNSLHKKSESNVYLDYAAATPVDPRILTRYNSAIKKYIGNSSGVNSFSLEAKEALTEARQTIGKLFNTKNEEVIFTSGATENANLAIQGFFRALNSKLNLKKFHAIISTIEHSSVLETLNYLKSFGLEVSLASVNQEGIVDLAEFKKLLKPNTVLVCIMAANNEIGSIQPIVEIGKIIRSYKKQLNKVNQTTPVLFCDMGQWPLYNELNLQKFPADFVSIDAGKFYSTSGTGVLIKNKKLKIQPLVFGGGQEHGLRSGTVNVAGAVALAEAIKIAIKGREVESKRLLDIKNYFLNQLKKQVKANFVVNGSLSESLPNILNLSFKKADGEFLAITLDVNGISCSTKSACLEIGGEGSYVVGQMTKDKTRVAGAIRFSFGRWSTKKDIDQTIKVLKKVLGFVKK